ncbi:metallophosphoesterase [Salininema proteolyticum]|uniref:Metallophosphoesterase n=1 Tax=Salininema proteolyticum TaxID=1607685 RepID=A0ABV8TW61_9ACTN
MTSREPTSDSEPGLGPRRLDAQRLGYLPQRSVKWLAPGTLADTALRLLGAQSFGAYLDKRELLSFYPQGVFDYSERSEIGLDYVADLGDGFNATYSIAHLLAQPKLHLSNSGEPLPGGEVLVMGGDEVYPAANWREYDNRTRGPYTTANPAENRDLFAVPGNHDWFDGLTAFSRLFLQRRHFGRWITRQTRSYFTLKLPHRWWLMAIDGGFDSRLDPPQLAYFRKCAAGIQPGDHVILCVPQPAWVWTEDDRQAFDRIDFFIDEIIRPRRARVPLILTGDRHHYARYQEDLPRDRGRPRHLITAGGGGGYLSPTHNLPVHITAPPPSSIGHTGSLPRDYTLKSAYPTMRRSWRYGFGIFGRLPWRNKSFVLFIGVVQLLAVVAVLQGVGTTVTCAAVLISVGIAFAHSTGPRKVKHYVLGVLHGAAQTALAVAGASVLEGFPVGGAWPYVGYIPVGGLAATWLVGFYLLVANRFGVNANELFAGLSVIDSKCFLRLKLNENGLTVHPIGVDRSARKWKWNVPTSSSPSRLLPAQPIRARHIEEPVTIPHPRPSSK